MAAPTEFDKKIKALIKTHRKTGSITLAQLNGILPDDMSQPDKLPDASVNDSVPSNWMVKA